MTFNLFDMYVQLILLILGCVGAGLTFWLAGWGLMWLFRWFKH